MAPRKREAVRELLTSVLDGTGAQRVRRFAVDTQVVIKLRLDLSDPKHRLRAEDRRGDFRVLPFDDTSARRVLEMLRAVDTDRMATIERRRELRTPGFVAEEHGEVVGYVFHTEGSGTPGALIHPDVAWLGLRVGPGEIFGFDYFVRPSSRGLGNIFARHTQEAQFALGYKVAYGQVYAKNLPALWTYRTTGWKEIGRVTERRLVNRFTVVDSVLYRVTPHGRVRIGFVPGLEQALSRT